jgi:hypothetical protein
MFDAPMPTPKYNVQNDTKFATKGWLCSLQSLHRNQVSEDMLVPRLHCKRKCRDEQPLYKATPTQRSATLSFNEA